jgi:hypothetical protein
MGDSKVDSRDVDARFAVVKALYGHMMDPNDFGTVRNRVEAVMRSIAELDSVELGLGDEPFSVFVPESSEE